MAARMSERSANLTTGRGTSLCGNCVVAGNFGEFPLICLSGEVVVGLSVWIYSTRNVSRVG